jgi:hypothetical protein
MVARMEWLNENIERMLAGKRPYTPEHWMVRERIIERDVDLLQQAARLNSLRPGAVQPDPGFVLRLRERMLAEAAE